MSINATLFVQMIVFAVLVWFTMKFVWPPIAIALDERSEKIAHGLAAAEHAKIELSNAHKEVELKLAETRNVKLNEEEAELRETVFPEFTPVEFAKLMRIGTWKNVAVGTTLTIQGQPVSEVVVVQSGHLSVEIDGHNVHTLNPSLT